MDNGNEIYDVRLLENNGSEFTAIGWLNQDRHGKFIGKLSHPFKIIINYDEINFIE